MKIGKMTVFQCSYCDKLYLKLDECLDCEDHCYTRKYECGCCGNQNVIKGTRCSNCGEIA